MSERKRGAGERDYTNRAQQRALRVVQALGGHEFDGLAPKELAQAVGTTPSNITRDLFNLQAVGWAEVLPSGRWRLGPKPVQLAVAFQVGAARRAAQLAEINQRYTREP